VVNLLTIYCERALMLMAAFVPQGLVIAPADHATGAMASLQRPSYSTDMPWKTGILMGAP